MPEGHSIHRIARQISDVFTGERVQVSSPQGRYAEGAALLGGAHHHRGRTRTVSTCL